MFIGFCPDLIVLDCSFGNSSRTCQKVMRNPREPNNYEESCAPHLISIKTSDSGSSGKKVPKIIVKLPTNSEGWVMQVLDPLQTGIETRHRATCQTSAICFILG